MSTFRDRYEKVLHNCQTNGDYTPLYDFIDMESKFILFPSKRKEFIGLIPEFIKYTNSSNYRWLYIVRINELEGFNDQVKKGLYELDAYKNGINYSTILSALDTKKFYDEKIVEYLASKDLTQRDMMSIFKDICFCDTKLGSLFLKRISTKIKNPDVVKNILSSIVSSYSKDRINILYDNLDFFIENIDDTFYLFFLVRDDIESQNKIKEYMANNIDTVLKKISPRNLMSLASLYSGDLKNKIIDYVINHFDEIINNYSPLELFDRFISDMNGEEKLEEKRKEYINSNFDVIIDKLYGVFNKTALRENVLNEEQLKERQAIKDLIRMVFSEVASNEGVEYSDIKLIGHGAFVYAFQVGDKIIKLGRSRASLTYPNNPFVLTPLIRKKFSIDGTKWYEGIFIEAVERVDVLTRDDVNEEELYGLYSKMRDIGLEWMDIEARNVGRLRKDNVIHWNEELAPSDEVLGLYPMVGDGIQLRKGDLVILDADFIFEEGKIPYEITHANEDEEYGFVRIWRMFNERYNQEHENDYGLH